jgi:small subunit ribosomal protein S15
MIVSLISTVFSAFSGHEHRNAWITAYLTLMLDAKTKQKIIKKYQTHGSDTGSSQVQIAILTEEIKELTDHLKQHRKDQSSRRGLLKKVNERKKLLKYLKREDNAAFDTLAKKLKLRIRSVAEKSVDDIEQEMEKQQKEKEEWEKLAEEQKKDKNNEE